MTPRERRRQIIAEAVRTVSLELAGTYQRQNRQEWAASRLADGWSERTVRDAVGAGALEMVRSRIRESNGASPDMPEHLARAMRALAIVDEQRRSTTRYGNNVRPHRPAGLPPRVRE